MAGVLIPLGAAASPAAATSGNPPAPSATQLTQSCELLNPATELGPSASLPANPVTNLVSPPGGVYTMVAGPHGVSVVNGNGVYSYDLSGTQTAHFALPSILTTNVYTGAPVGSNGISQPVVDGSGNIYVSSYYGDAVVSFTPAGAVRWTQRPDSLPTNIFAATSGGTFELGVSTVASSTSTPVYSAAGTAVGSVALVVGTAGYASVEPSGDILYATGSGEVQTWSADARTQLSQFGTATDEGADQYTGGPYSFFYPGEAALGSDGQVYAADGLSTLTATSPSGILAGDTTLGGALGGSRSVDGDLSAVGTNLYLATSPPFDSSAGSVSVVPLAAVAQFLSAPQTARDTLGWGAGLHSTRTANYFAPGTTVGVYAAFESWWAADSAHLQLRYSVWNDAALTTGTPPAATTVPLPSTPSALADLALTVPAADTVAGPYEVRADLVDTTASPPEVVGSTCMPYTVGATGDRLDLASLPPGSSDNGPADPRGVALNAQLGLNALRGATVDWSDFLPSCQASAPTAATCGPTAMSFAAAPQGYFQAAYLARADREAYWMLVSSGVDGISQALVNGGWWQADVQALVGYYATVPSGCTDCAPVTAFEAWNEANITGYPDGATFVPAVMEPFYKAVKAAEPTATVIGGSTVDIPLTWWNQFVSAGGRSYVDVAAVHPYPGNNDSWNEDGEQNQVRSLKQILGATPLWFSEIGWWSDKGYNYIAQANQVAESIVWEAALGIPVTSYFYDEGGPNLSGVHFGLIQTDQGADDYVKPAALTTMTADHMLSGQTDPQMLSTQIPGTFETTFEATGATAPDLTAVWTDGSTRPSVIRATSPKKASVPVTITNEYGSAATVSLTSGSAYELPLTDEVTYVSYPAGDTVKFGPTVAYGTNLAFASSGTTASATSGSGVSALQKDPLYATGYGQGWTSGPGDAQPAVTLTFSSAQTIDRVIVDTQSMGSTASGVRSYTISVATSGGGWQTVASVANQFRYHVQETDFSPVSTTAVRVTVNQVNYGGYFGGGIPNFWPANSPDGAFLHAVEVYPGTATPAQLQGTGLPVLP